MLTSRSFAARSVTSRPPISTRPLVTARARRHPQRRRLAAADGPSSVTSCPGWTVNETSSTATTSR